MAHEQPESQTEPSHERVPHRKTDARRGRRRDPVARSIASVGETLRQFVRTLVLGVGILVEYDRFLWLIAVCFFGVGDLVTTGVGLSFGRVVEVGPVAIPVVGRYGMAGMIVLKASVLGAFYGFWRHWPTTERVGIPLGLATTGVLVTAWNLLVLVVAQQ